MQGLTYSSQPGLAMKGVMQVPPPTMLKMAKRALRRQRGSFRSHPLFQRIPTGHCGNCGRIARCCTFTIPNTRRILVLLNARAIEGRPGAS